MPVSFLPSLFVMESIGNTLSWDDFMKVEIRVGTVISAEVFTAARKPAYKLVIDFGPLGTRKSSAQITRLYTPEDIIGKQVVAVVNFPPKQIATLRSECLVLGAVDGEEVTLLTPNKQTTNGLRVG